MSEEIKESIKRIREMQDWRRGVGKYAENTDRIMPVHPRTFGADIDKLIDFIEAGGMTKSDARQVQMCFKTLDNGIQALKKIIDEVVPEVYAEVQKNQKFYLHCLSVLSSMEASVQLLKNRMKNKE